MIGLSAIGVQISSNKRTGFGAWLDACHVSDAPVACVFAVDQEVAREVKQRSPRTPVFFRSKQSPLGEDTPQGIDHADNQEEIAEEWMASLRPLYEENAGFDYAVFDNEWDIGDLDAGAKINRFNLRCMQIIDRWGLGFHAGALSFSTGNPKDDPLADGTPLSMEQRLETILPAIQYACEHGHVLVFHVHANDVVTTGEHVALRIHRILRYLADASKHPTFGSLHPLCAFGEFSNGVEGIEPNLPAWLIAVKWFDEQLRHSPWRDQIIGFALYGYTAAATIAPAIDDLIEWMTDLPELPAIDPTDPPPPDPIRHYDRVAHLVPPSVPTEPDEDGQFDSRYMQILTLAGPGRESVLASADDAFINPPQCVSRTVYVYNVGEWGGKDYFEAWVNEWYPPLPTIIYRELAA